MKADIYDDIGSSSHQESFGFYHNFRLATPLPMTHSLSHVGLLGYRCWNKVPEENREAFIKADYLLQK